MTLLAWLRGHHEWPTTPSANRMTSDCAPSSENISMVVPVRDNQEGIDALVRWWTPLHADELVVVDDGSAVPIVAKAPNVRVIRTGPRGPAAARNTGWQAARTPWVAFVDSDCAPGSDWQQAFKRAWKGEVAIQGGVSTKQRHAFARYYESQRVLTPMHWDNEGRPRYLITANALVWRPALERIGGFQGAFPLAAGEDIDLGCRLAEVGSLGWAPEALVTHAWEPSLLAFVRRFHRYGRGNRTLARVRPNLAPLMRPFPFLPESGGASNMLLAQVAWLALAAGWFQEGTDRRTP